MTGYQRRRGRTPRRIAGDQADLAGWPRLVDEFCEWMATRHYSPNTITDRRAQLARLTVWLADRGVTRPVEVTRPMLESYQRWLFHYRKADGTPLAYRSQNQRLVAAKMFFRWAARARHLIVNPASELELPRAERRLPRPALSATEAELVLAQPDLSTATGVRDRAMLELLYATGIRRAELAHLAVVDIDTDRATVFVRHGKGGRDRMIPAGDRALAWVHKYLTTARPRLVAEPDEGALFVSADGVGFGPDRLGVLVARYVTRSGVPKQGSCHLFRHTCATVMLEGGADIRFIQAMLGHARLDTTEIYTHVSIRTLQAVHAATHPAAGNARPVTGDESGELSTDGPVTSDETNGADHGGPMDQLLAALDEEDQLENRADMAEVAAGEDQR